MGGEGATRVAISLTRAQWQDDIGAERPRTLMQQLIIGVLSDGTGRAPQYWCCVVFKQLSRWRDPLAVALHGQLLQEVRQMSELLGIG